MSSLWLVSVFVWRISISRNTFTFNIVNLDNPDNKHLEVGQNIQFDVNMTSFSKLTVQFRVCPTLKISFCQLRVNPKCCILHCTSILGCWSDSRQTCKNKTNLLELSACTIVRTSLLNSIHNSMLLCPNYRRLVSHKNDHPTQHKPCFQTCRQLQHLLLSTLRCMELDAVGSQVTLEHWDRNTGLLSIFVELFYRRSIEEGFQRMTAEFSKFVDTVLHATV